MSCANGSRLEFSNRHLFLQDLFLQDCFYSFRDSISMDIWRGWNVVIKATEKYILSKRLQITLVPIRPKYLGYLVDK